jgi:hypothetical protein
MRFLEENADADLPVDPVNFPVPASWSRESEEQQDEAGGPPLSAEEVLKHYAAGERGFAKAELGSVCFRGADFSGCNFAEADFTSADLSDSNLARANLEDADFVGANLQRANLRGSNLRGADFTGAVLVGADLTGADIRGADFTDARLLQTNFTRSIRDRSTNLAGHDLALVICDTDLTAEVLRGQTATERIDESMNLITRVAGWVAAILLAVMLGILGGGLAGNLLEFITGGRNLVDKASQIGAAFGAGVAIFLLARPVRPKSKG